MNDQYFYCNRMTLREFTPEDAEILKERAINELSPYWTKYADYFNVAGPAYVGYYRGELMGAIGIILKQPDKGTVWAAFTPAIRKYPKALMYCCRDMIGIMMRVCSIDRLRAYSDASYIQSQRFLEHVGFKRVRHFRNFYYYRYEVS